MKIRSSLLAFSVMVICLAVMMGTTNGKQTFLVVYRAGSAWPPGKTLSELPLKEHGKYMLSLYGKGVLKEAGPFTDNAGGAVVLEVSDETEAKSIAENDPAVKANIFIYEAHPWGLVDWEKIKKN